jgi:hypothetical protein
MIPMQKLWVDPAKLPEMTEELFIETVTVAALALERMDFLIEALPEGVDLWVCEITESERQFVRRLGQENPVDAEMRARLLRVLDEQLEIASVDEVAFAAVQAVIWAARSLKLRDAL